MIRAGVLLAALLAVSANPVRAAGPVRIGCLAALSGAGADIGNRLREGAIAAHPIINGRPVELILRDARSDPTVAQQQAASLVADGVSGLLCVTPARPGATLAHRGIQHSPPGKAYDRERGACARQSGPTLSARSAPLV